MNRYLLVTDNQERLVFKKKLERNDNLEELVKQYKILDFVYHVLEGQNFKAALASKGLQVSQESAFYLKANLKEDLFFTDKKIKEWLGEPDFIQKAQTSGNVLFLYAKSRVEKVMMQPYYIEHAKKVNEGRINKIIEINKENPFTGYPKKASRNSSENAAKEKIRELAGRLRKDWDLNEYKVFFPKAREIERKHILFVGPTNSGKSFKGLNELASARSGAYLAPLRLLALEGQEEIEKRDQVCSLITGEEMEIKEGAQFVASTIEMANLDKPIDCALIDEVQLILDTNRGWAWSQALIGIPAKKIIMTGSPECIPTLKKLIEEYLGERLEIIYLDRIGKLELLQKPIGNLNQLEAASAIIAFSRRGVLAFKRQIEDLGRRVSVLYGNLGPGVRREEARRFRSGETDILIATDCIGMGLNLPIKTVIFSETSKFDGKEVRELTPQEVKQIAGRAGRYGKHECGYVGVLSQASIHIIRKQLHIQLPSFVNSCCVRPTETQLEVLKEQIGKSNIKTAISLFSQLSKEGSTIVCSDLTEMLAIADRIENHRNLAELSFSDKYLFSCAPVSSTEAVADEYIRWLVSYSNMNPVLIHPNEYSKYTERSTSEDRILNDAENCVKTLTLYHWLARKKPEFFPSIEICEELREKINLFIENSLKTRKLHRKCPICGQKMKFQHPHKLCDSCFRKNR